MVANLVQVKLKHTEATIFMYYPPTPSPKCPTTPNKTNIAKPSPSQS